jgi:hypothetical protein
MPEPPPPFRYEYITGGVITATYPVVAHVHAINRGGVPEYVRARCWRDRGVLFGDSEVQEVIPLDVLDYEFSLTEGEGFGHPGFLYDIYWLQIFTTSNALVPSAAFRDPWAGLRVDQEPSTADSPDLFVRIDANIDVAYFAPGDFAAFELDPRVSVPPVGPPETTGNRARRADRTL